MFASALPTRCRGENGSDQRASSADPPLGFRPCLRPPHPTPRWENLSAPIFPFGLLLLFSLQLPLPQTEVSEPRAASELQLRPTPQPRQYQILNSLSKARDGTRILMETASGPESTEHRGKLRRARPIQPTSSLGERVTASPLRCSARAAPQRGRGTHSPHHRPSSGGLSEPH